MGKGPKKNNNGDALQLKATRRFQCLILSQLSECGDTFFQTQRERSNLLKVSQLQMAFEERPLNPICLIASTLFHLGRKFLTETSIFAKRTSVEGSNRGELKEWQLCMPGWGGGQNPRQSRTRCMPPT